MKRTIHTVWVKFLINPKVTDTYELERHTILGVYDTEEAASRSWHDIEEDLRDTTFIVSEDVQE